MDKKITIIEAPLAVGAGLSGVEQLPSALLRAGRDSGFSAGRSVVTIPVLTATEVDPKVGIPEPERVRDFLLELAAKVEAELADGAFPVVVGGDCTVLLGCLAGARRLDNLALFFVDGHTDFNVPGAPDHETASMDLAIATGTGPRILTELDGQAPLVPTENVVAFGFRDETAIRDAGGATVPSDTEMLLLPLSEIRSFGFGNALARTLERFAKVDAKVWLHLDVDVLDDIVLPAVDYRMPGGLGIGEVVAALREVLSKTNVVGLNVTILNPKLDWDGSRVRLLDSMLTAVFSEKHSVMA